MEMTSRAFSDGESIPKVYTCQGDNVIPPLTVNNVPKETKSLALIMEDPDAPGGTFVHWLIWNIPPTTTEIEENGLNKEIFVGTNSANMIMYIGPCPPSGRHRYFFKLYALDAKLKLITGSKASDLLKAMEGRTIEKCELVGTYEKEME